MVAGGVVVVAAAMGCVFLFGPAGVGLAVSQEQSRPTAIPAMAPSDSDTFVVAPYSKEWWGKVASMTSPVTGLAALDPEAGGLSIENVGYSRSQDHTKRDVPRTGPLRLFYAESSTPEAAEKVAAWLREAPGFEGRREFVDGKTVIVAPSWVNTFEPPTATMAKVPGFAAQVTNKTASMWRNVDMEIPAVVGDTTSPRAAVISTVLAKGYGFTGGTTWVGTSQSGDSWSGSFKTGGVNPAQIDFKAAQDAVSGTQKVLDKVEFSKTKYEILDSGMTEALTGASFVAPGQTGQLGGGAPANVPGVKDPAITAITDVTRFDAAASGIDSSLENISSQAVSANAHDMIVSYRYGSSGH